MHQPEEEQFLQTHCQTSYVNLILVGNKIVDESAVVGALPVGIQIYLHSRLNSWLQWNGQWQLEDETKNIYVLRFGAPYVKGLAVI